MKSFQQLRIVFFGTPDFAVASLKALKDAGCNVIAAVTSADKPSGRGLQQQSSAVKTFALQRNLLVFQPPNLKHPQFLADLKSLDADLFVVVAFRMLPEAVWNMPPLGTVNVHASLLPQYRGAAPINRAIMNGERETGVTTFKLQHAIDTGNILLQERVPILPGDNAGTLHDKLKEAGARLLVETVKGLADDTIREQSQSIHGLLDLQHAPKIFKEDSFIRWGQPAERIHNLIRGLSPYPAAFTTYRDKVLKIFESSFEIGDTKRAPGTFDSDGKTYLRAAAEDGWVYLKEVQLEGKKRMGIEAFLRGLRA